MPESPLLMPKPIYNPATGQFEDLSPLNPLPARVGGWTERRSATLIRTNNANQYTANHAVWGTPNDTDNDRLRFSNCARLDGGSGMIVGARCVCTANQATKPQLELWTFSAPPAPDADNTAFTPSNAELSNLVGIFPFTVWTVGTAGAGAAGNCVSYADNLNRVFVCQPGDRALYNLLVVRNAYTPTSLEEYLFTLFLSQD
jgi:hypothetical protein